MRRIIVLCVLAAAVGAGSAPPAQGVRCNVSVCPETLTSAHFRVHFNAQPDISWRINVIQAHEIATMAERAYASYVGWGFAPPLDDGDGLIDIYTHDLVEAGYEPWGAAFPDVAPALTSPGHIELDSRLGIDEHKVAHLVFHVFQRSAWNQLDPWLREAGAEWAAFRHLGFPANVFSYELGADRPLLEFLGRPEMPLDCAGNQCGDAFYEVAGQSDHPHWSFLTYVGERFGTSFLKDVIDRAVASGDPSGAALDFVSEALVARGTSFADTFTDWTVAQMAGGYQAPALAGATPTRSATVLTGTKSGSLPPQRFGVSRLSTRYLAIRRGSGASAGPCHAATLNLSVGLPAGVGARPYFFWTGERGPAIPLAVSGTTATLSIPWDTCTWANAEGLLSLPNPSRTLTTQDFVVSGSLVVDAKRLATPTPPPAGTYTGPTVPAPDVEDAPSLALYGPETLRVSRKKRLLRLVVFSSGSGKVEAHIGASLLGSRTLRAGSNDLRFTLPKPLTRGLASTGTLRVTSMSPSGTHGSSVTRKLRLTK